MPKERSTKDKLMLVLKGLAMGTANKVPGVSGGIVAFVAGFYEEFIYSLQKINLKALKLLFSGRYRSFFKYINIVFLGYLILGMLISYFSVSLFLDYLLIHYETYVWSAFFGMILGSIYYISADFKSWSASTVLTCLVGIAIGLSISFMEPAIENRNLYFVFFCGLISVSGMVLPGLSGSFLLILVGNYVLLLVDSVTALYKTISEIITGDFTAFADPERLDILLILLVFTLGSITGLVTLSQILSYVLKKAEKYVLVMIIGFISGSLGIVWPWKEIIYKSNNQGQFLLDSEGNKIIASYQRYLPILDEPSTLLSFLFILMGVVLIVYLERYNKKNTS